MIFGYKGVVSVTFAFVLLFFGTFVANATTKKLIVRGSDRYPPLEFINASGEPEGFNVDIIRALMVELGYDYELQLRDWAEVVQDIQSKNIDVVIGMIYSQERAASVRFTLPTCIINRNLITRKSNDYRSLEDLEGKEVIVEKGGWFHRYLLEYNFAGKIIESEDIYQSLKLLSTGNYDAILASDLVTLYAMKQSGVKDLKIKNLGLDPQNYAIAVNQDRDDLLFQLNIGLQQLKLSGTYDQIYNKWFGIYESKKNRETLFIALIIFLAIALILISFLWLLRRQVAKATRLLNNSKQEVGIAIDAGRISAWIFTIHDRTIKSLHGNSLGGSGAPIERIYEKIHPDDTGLVQGEFEALSAGGKKATTIAFRIREEMEEGYRYVETKMLRVEVTKELPCRIIGTLKDVTEDVAIREKLEEYQTKSEFIIKVNGITLTQYDVYKQCFARINEDESRENTSYSIDQYLSMVYPEDLPIATQFVAKLNKAEESKIDTEFRIISEDGTYSWYNVTTAAYKYDDHGRITSYMGLRRDDTKWKAINNDLILLREKAEASNKLKSAFLANMSHEIRTPLNAIVGFSELIIDMDDKEEQAEFIEIVKTNNELLLQLINDVLDLSRIEAGYINFNYDMFDFSEYFRELGMSLKLKASKNVELVCVNRYEDLKICSDRNRITQVITNFVTNAFKFTAKGCVTLDYVYENDGIKVSVTDSGIGITSDNLNRVFERFEKLNDFAQGTGLGLSICKVIIEALQGKIGVESEFGVGSRFWFWLPCGVAIDEQQLEIRNATSGFSIADITSGQSLDSDEKILDGKKTILVAEDLDNNYLIIRAVIKDVYHVIRAENGLEAIEKAKRYHPDIILMDMKMPLMGGLDATIEIRKFDPEVPIIALTAYVFDTNRQDALHAGCNDFLTKPVNRSVLMRVLENCK